MNPSAQPHPLDEKMLGVVRLKLVLAIAFGLKTAETISRYECVEVLNLHETATPAEIKQECAEVLFAWFMETRPSEPIDEKGLAVALLEQIKAAGGLLRPHEVIGIPDAFLNALADDHVIVAAPSGVKWGHNAERAIRDYRKSRAEKKVGEENAKLS